MQRKELELFKDIPVKLRKKDGYSINGTIKEIFEDSILFKTWTAQSLISMDSIDEIVEINGGDK